MKFNLKFVIFLINLIYVLHLCTSIRVRRGEPTQLDSKEWKCKKNNKCTGRYVNEDSKNLVNAVFYENWTEAKKLLRNCEYPNQKGPGGERTTALHYAARHGEEIIVKQLLEYGATVDLEDSDKNIPLMYAANNENQQKYLGVGRALLECGANVQHKNNDKSTSLHYAAEKGNWMLAELLLKKGADKDATNKAKETPLMKAVINGHLEFVKDFLKYNPNLSIENKNDRTALQYANLYNQLEIANVLRKAGAKE